MINAEKSVLVTGASAGIGRATALHLDSLGMTVFAGVRRKADGEALTRVSSPRLTPVILDVTQEHTIAEVVAEISTSTGGTLGALVNNAGRSLNGPLELLPVADVRSLFEVNVLGLLAVTRACIPLLRRGRGRLIKHDSTSTVAAADGERKSR